VGCVQALWLTMYGFINLSHSVEAILIGIVAQAVMSVLSIQVVVQFCYLLPNYDMAMLASITHATMTILLGGFVVQLPDLIPFMRAISFLFPLRYCFQIMMHLQLKVRLPLTLPLFCPPFLCCLIFVVVLSLFQVFLFRFSPLGLV
jgi:hypothetical protein